MTPVAVLAGADAWVHPGGLSDAELAVVHLIAEGRTTRECAGFRGTSIHTVRVQLYAIYKKLQVRHRGELVLWAVRHGMGGIE